MNTIKLYNHPSAFSLESGESLDSLQIAYHTYGNLNESKNNVIWVCHALTANSDVFDWWSGVFGENDLFNPKDHVIVCANIIGSCYGTSGPLNTEKNGELTLDKFPFVTTRDLAKAHDVLRIHLGLEKINLLIGASLGGQQALEWSIDQPTIIENLIILLRMRAIQRMELPLMKHNVWPFLQIKRLEMEMLMVAVTDLSLHVQLRC